MNELVEAADESLSGWTKTFTDPRLCAAIGASCGGLYAYYFEHLLSKEELARLGSQLPAEASALVAFVRETDGGRLLGGTQASDPVTVSVAAVDADLTAAVRSTSKESLAATADDGLTMIVARFAGEHVARETLGGQIPSKQKDKSLPLIDLFVEANRKGRRHVSDPTNAGLAFSLPDALSWAGFGLV